MNKAQIIEMARAAGISVTDPLQVIVGDKEGLARFAQLVADHALEEAAKACEARAEDAPAPLAAECLLCAVATRAMKGKP